MEKPRLDRFWGSFWKMAAVLEEGEEDSDDEVMASPFWNLLTCRSGFGGKVIGKMRLVSILPRLLPYSA